MRKQKLNIGISVASIAICLGLFLFAGWAIAEKTIRTGTSFPDKAELEAVKRDLAEIDSDASAQAYGNASVIIGQDIKARDVYRLYLKHAEGISADLLNVRKQLDLQARTVNLQQLGALTQRLSLDNARFKNAFTHGEEEFHTYQLIEKAVISLEDAVRYWRIANEYRPIYRGSAREKGEDDEILKLKLQTAMNAADALSAIIDTRKALEQDLDE
jgi:hypothetical protein